MKAITNYMNKTMSKILERRTDINDPNFYYPYETMTKIYPSKEWAKVHEL